MKYNSEEVNENNFRLALKQIYRRPKSKRITVQVCFISNNNTKITVLLFRFATYMKTTKKSSQFLKHSIAKYLKIHFCGITCTEQTLIWKQCSTELFIRDHSWKIRYQREAEDQLTMWVWGLLSVCCAATQTLQQHSPTPGTQAQDRRGLRL